MKENNFCFYLFPIKSHKVKTHYSVLFKISKILAGTQHSRHWQTNSLISKLLHSKLSCHHCLAKMRNFTFEKQQLFRIIKLTQPLELQQFLSFHSCSCTKNFTTHTHTHTHVHSSLPRGYRGNNEIKSTNVGSDEVSLHNKSARENVSSRGSRGVFFRAPPLVEKNE